MPSKKGEGSNQYCSETQTKLKVKALKRLESNNFNLKKTATELHIAPNTLRYWQKTMGEEIFTKKPDAHLVQQAVNTEKRVEITKLETKVKIELAISMATDIMIERLTDPKTKKKISNKDIIALMRIKAEEVANAANKNQAFSEVLERLVKAEGARRKVIVSDVEVVSEEVLEESQVLNDEKE